jgi:CheY-like chemotaxis protein
MTTRILLVEDDEAYRYSLAKVLSHAGFETVIAENYMEALAAFENGAKINLLLADVVMPAGVNGFALARMARMRHPDLKILYLTAFDVPTSEALGKILKKPIGDDELLSEVREALKG